MLIGALNFLFALGFAQFAWRSAPRGWFLLRSGWQIVALHAGQPDARRNVQHRRAISQGGSLLLAGLAWLGATLVSAGLALAFLLAALPYTPFWPA